jgi:hypothetical protein
MLAFLLASPSLHMDPPYELSRQAKGKLSGCFDCNLDVHHWHVPRPKRCICGSGLG